MFPFWISVLFWIPHFAAVLVSATPSSSSTSSSAHLRNIEDENVPLHIAEAVQGTQGRLPCNVTPPISDDKVILVIWYKDGLPTPIYSFDVRDAKFEKGSHWVDEKNFGGRAYFKAAARPASLVIDNTTNSDTGMYRCRVDFHKSPTRNARVELRVIIPPEKVLMLDERGVHIPNYILGPYNEDSSVNITCVSIGGIPLPNVTWIHENTVLKSKSMVLSEKRVKNVLHLEKIKRHHLHMVLTCQASNNNITLPISSSVTLDLNLRPLWVRLQGENRALSANNQYELHCQVVGSKPEPTITWWKGSQPMKDTRTTVSEEGNMTTSILTYTPTIDDRGKYLSCRAEQALIPDSGKEDGWKLDIFHIPVVTLEFGTNLNTTYIREGADVYFECNIKSNPWIYRVSWRHNGKILDNNILEGIIVANQSLVLQNVSRSRMGLYTCVGSNREGDGESNPVQLDIKFVPICRPGQRDIYTAARNEAVKVNCEVEANPQDIQFTWVFNSSSAETIDIPTSDIFSDRTKSTAKYVPHSEHDYGSLVCWGSNELGKQAEPCVFNILPAGPPDPVTNCSILNITYDMIQTQCVEGFNGGLPQAFQAEIFDGDFRQLIKTTRSRLPSFYIHGLQSGIDYGILFYAFNDKGKSNATKLMAYTLKNPEKQTDLIITTPVIEDIRPFIGILMGAVGGLVLIAFVIVIIVRLRGSSGQDRNNNSPNNLCVNHIPTNNLSNADSAESLEKNPDIIPQGGNEEEDDDGEKRFQWINANNGPRMYATAAMAEQSGFGTADGYAFTQYVQSPTVLTTAGQTYLSSMPNTVISPYNMTNFSPHQTPINDLTYADLSMMSQAGKKFPYTTATLGRPNRQPMMEIQEPTIYAQIDLAKHQPTYPAHFAANHPGTVLRVATSHSNPLPPILAKTTADTPAQNLGLPQMQSEMKKILQPHCSLNSSGPRPCTTNPGVTLTTVAPSTGLPESVEVVQSRHAACQSEEKFSDRF